MKLKTPQATRYMTRILNWKAVSSAVLISLAAQMPISAFASQQTVTDQRLLLDVIINGQDTHNIVLFLQDPSNQLYVSGTYLQSWKLNLPGKPAFIDHGTAYYALSQYTGLQQQVNINALTIQLQIPTHYFQNNTINNTSSAFITPQKAPYGAYSNYTLFASGAINASNPQTSTQSALLAPTIFGPEGNFNNQFLLQHTPDSTQNQTVRLLTNYQIDLPDKMQTLTVGDSYTTPGAWGTALPFGGISWSTDFATQPNYDIYPLPSVAGQTAIPTTVDLYVNNALANTEKVPTGPFTINNIPVVTGAGMVNVVTTNALGQQQVISLPYYTDPGLLKPGLQDFSYQLGWLRQNLGTQSNDYSQAVAVVSDRVGVTNTLTAEGDIQATSQIQNAGASLTYVVDNLFTVNSAFALGNSDQGRGQLFQLGVERQNNLGMSYGINGEVTSADFYQIGSLGTPSPSLQLQSFIGATLFNKYSLGLSYTQQNYSGMPNLNFLSLSLSSSLTRDIFWTVTALSNITGPSNKEINLSLMCNFGTDYNLSLSHEQTHDDGTSTTQNTLDFNKAAPSGPGYGYDLQATSANNANQQGTLYLNTQAVDTQLQLAQQSGDTYYQAEAQGAVTYINKDVYFTPPVQDSFAIAELPGLPGIPVYYNNQLVGDTNTAGDVLVPDLQPYTSNEITIDPEKLPINTEIDATEADVIPYANEGALIKMPVHVVHSATATLLTADHRPVPSDATVTINQSTELTYVGYNGEVYFNNLQTGMNTVTANWQGGSCVAQVNYPADGIFSTDTAAQLNPFTLSASQIETLAAAAKQAKAKPVSENAVPFISLGEITCE